MPRAANAWDRFSGVPNSPLSSENSAYLLKSSAGACPWAATCAQRPVLDSEVEGFAAERLRLSATTLVAHD